MDENNINGTINDGPLPKGMKVCKTCGKRIAKNAKTCPHCGAKQKGKLGLIVIIIIVLLLFFAAVGRGGSSSDSSSEPTADSTKETVEEITYTEYSMADLTSDLENNAAAANEKYKGQYVILTGKLANIDAQGDYISIEDPDADFTMTRCQCYIKNNKEEISAIVKTLSKGDIITVKGKITDVGEVMGYSLDIDEIISE